MPNIRYRFNEITIIRPRTILGHGRLGIFSILFDWMKIIKIPLLNNGSNLYQFVHAEDLADACILSLNQKKQKGILILGQMIYSQCEKY